MTEFLAYSLISSGGENPSRRVPAAQADHLAALLRRTHSAGARLDLRWSGRGGVGLSWGSGASAQHLIVRNGVVRFFRENGESATFADNAGLGDFLREVLRDDVWGLNRAAAR